MKTLIDWLIRYRWLLFVLSLGLIALSVYSFRFFYFDASPRIYFKEGDTEYERLVQMEEVYGRDYKVFMMLSSRGADMFSSDNIRALKEITEKSWELPFVRRVDSLANYQFTRAENDELIVTDLLEDQVLVDPALRSARKAYALSDVDVLNRLVSPDGKHAAVILSLIMDGEDTQSPEGVAMVEETYRLVEQIENRFPDIEIAVSGNTISTYHNMKVAEGDFMLMIPIMLVLMFVLLGVLLRSGSTILIALVIAFLSAIGAIGLASLLGVQFSILALNAVIISITVSVAHCIHIFTQFFKNLVENDKREALAKSLQKIFSAVTVTSLTTVIGFLSLNTNDLPPAAALGNAAALGAAMAWLLSLTMLPAMVLVLPFKPHKTGEFWLEKRMAALAELVIARKWFVLLAMLAVTIMMGWFASQNELNDNLSQTLHESHPFRKDNEAIDRYFGSMYINNYELDSGEENGIADPNYLKKMDEFATFLRTLPELSSVYSFADIVKRLNQTMHNDDPAYYRIPDDRELIAQYILLYELSLPFGLDLSERVTPDKRKTLLIASMPSMDTDTNIALDQKIWAWQQANLPPHMLDRNISMSTIWSYLTIHSVSNSMQGALLALLLISSVLLFLLRSIRYGVISLLPNLVPAVFGFGVWYFISGNIGLGLTCVVIITIGIVVDDTVHYLVKYQAALAQYKGNVEQAIRHTYRQVGPAMVITTMVLASGFAVLSVSKIIMNSAMGQVTSTILLSALVLDLLLLPALLLVLDLRSATRATEGNNTPSATLKT